MLLYKQLLILQANANLDFSVAVVYVQADNHAEVVDHSMHFPFVDGEYFATNPGYTFNTGQSLSNGMPFYTTPFAKIGSSGSPFFIKTNIEDNKVVSASLGFLYNHQIYYLKQGADSYQTNYDLLDDIMGGSCITSSSLEGGESDGYMCLAGDYDIMAFTDGRSYVGNSELGCYLNSTSAYCSN